MENNLYPQLLIDLKKLKDNADEIIRRCGEAGIAISCVVKGVNGIPELTKTLASTGCKFVASSRIEQLKAARDSGVKIPLMMIRVPMLSEVAEIVKVCHASLNIEVAVLEALNAEAVKQGKIHEVILMADLGDLREGFWDKEELLDAAKLVENELPGLKLAGVGTNLGCYGSIDASPEKLGELVSLAEAIEAKINRKLDYISGGGTTSLPCLLDGNMPPRINHLRVGEAILLGRDISELFGRDASFLHQDVLTLRAEVIEIRDKPSYPVGDITFDAFGNKPVYVDRGTRKRALLALGKMDYAFPDKIFPRCAGIEILGASSDHTILDIEEVASEIKLGDILEFDLCYASMIYATNSQNVKQIFI